MRHIAMDDSILEDFSRAVNRILPSNSGFFKTLQSRNNSNSINIFKHFILGEIMGSEETDSYRINCPFCGEKVINPENNDLVLRNRIVIFHEDGATARCKRCGRAVRIPVRLVN